MVSGGGIVTNFGGSASGTIVSGQDFLESGAVETSATVNRFGAEFIASGGTAIGVTASGLINLASGGVLSGTVTFGPFGQLQLADSQDFHNLVAGFSGINVQLDLQDITYVASGANATTINWTQLTSGASGSGTLTVSQGGHAANITLIGQYATGNFVISGDGGAGTLLIDPPLAADDSATVFVNPRHSEV